MERRRERREGADPRSREGTRARRPLRVLVSEDDYAIRLLCRVNLEIEGMQVVEAADGRQALELALASPPDVAILDVSTPGLDGWQVAQALRGHAATAHVGIVFMTAHTGPAALQRAHELGGLFLAK